LLSTVQQGRGQQATAPFCSRNRQTVTRLRGYHARTVRDIRSRSADLARFKAAQGSAAGGFAAAMAELKAGTKRGHWIWYVFPQLAGLGRSQMSRKFALRDLDEARAYASDPVLLGRLLEISTVVGSRLTEGVDLTTLMGAQLDALKLVSSLTLFERVVDRLGEGAGNESHRALASVAKRILAAAEAQGYPRCKQTLHLLR
jgi:uncharacterized protein (DUF1810 family)